jgi:2-iminobutanoate/2-iminopropanoate deaminase
MQEIISTNNAPKAIGPYSQAVKVNNFMFLSGQLPLDPQTMTLVEGDIEVQTNQIFKNMKAVLNEAQLDFNHVVKTTIFLKNMSDFKKVNEVYGSYFTGNYPARSTVQVAALPLNADIEIEAIAFL